MQGLRDRDVFRFCAIPQIMSIGTLAQLYNNGKVFEGGWAIIAGVTWAALVAASVCACTQPVFIRTRVIRGWRSPPMSWLSACQPDCCPSLALLPMYCIPVPFNPGAGVVKLRRGLTARVFSECEGMQDLLSWFLMYLHELQEKALMQVDEADPTRKVSMAMWDCQRSSR
jgi:hypothetical protein